MGTEQLRNVVIVGQGGVGKTSIADAILFAAGATTRLGRVDDESSVFDTEKLSWLNGRHLSERPANELVDHLREQLQDVEGFRAELLEDPEWVDALLEVIKVRARTLDELADQARPFLCDHLVFDEKAVQKHWAKDPSAALERLERVGQALDAGRWSSEELEERLRSLAAEMEMGAGKLIHPLRVALTGNMASPGIFDVLTLLGRERANVRIRAGLERIRAA